MDIVYSTGFEKKYEKDFLDIYENAFDKEELVPSDALLEEIYSGQGELLLALQSDKLIGFIISEVAPKQNIVLIAYLAVAKNCRGQGIAAALLTKHLQLLSNRYSNCAVVLEAKDHLLPFYDRFDFKLITKDHKIKSPIFGHYLHYNLLGYKTDKKDLAQLVIEAFYEE